MAVTNAPDRRDLKNFGKVDNYTKTLGYRDFKKFGKLNNSGLSSIYSTPSGVLMSTFTYCPLDTEGMEYQTAEFTYCLFDTSSIP